MCTQLVQAFIKLGEDNVAIANFDLFKLYLFNISTVFTSPISEPANSHKTSAVIGHICRYFRSQILFELSVVRVTGVFISNFATLVL